MIPQEGKSYRGIRVALFHEKVLRRIFRKTSVTNKPSPCQTSSPSTWIASHLDFCWGHTYFLITSPRKPWKAGIYVQKHERPPSLVVALVIFVHDAPRGKRLKAVWFNSKRRSRCSKETMKRTEGHLFLCCLVLVKYTWKFQNTLQIQSTGQKHIFLSRPSDSRDLSLRLLK